MVPLRWVIEESRQTLRRSLDESRYVRRREERAAREQKAANGLPATAVFWLCHTVPVDLTSTAVVRPVVAIVLASESSPVFSD